MGKKILIISELSVWSMGENKGAPSLWRTLKGYIDHGWEVFFIIGNKESCVNLDKKIKIFHVDCPCLKRLTKIKKIGFFARSSWWLLFQLLVFIKAQKIHSKHNINVVYGYEFSGVPVAKAISVLWRIPVVARFQGSTLKVFWMNKKLWQIRAFQHWVAHKIPVDLVVMTNDGTHGDKVLEYFNVNKEKIRFWINGVDRQLLEARPDKEEIRRRLKISSKYVLITMSRLAWWKRIDRAIRALGETIKIIPDITLLIIGEGSERKNLEELAGERVGNHVRFIGAVDHNEALEYLAAADIFLSFNVWSNLGNPLLEAMMAGKCIITLDNGDTRSVVRGGVNGILIEERDEEELIKNISRSIVNLIQKPRLREELGKNAREFANKNLWDWEQRMDAEIKEVEKLLKNKIK